MAQYHEPTEELGNQDRNFTRALNSLKEEIEAVDWYHQRVVSSDEDPLKKILEHNKQEEIEHACMVIEWLRRNMPGWDEQLRTYLFTEGDITELEEGEESEGGETKPRASFNLGIGNMKE